MKKFLRYFYTLRYLRWKQIFFRFFYLVRRRTPWQPRPDKCDRSFDVSPAPVMSFLSTHKSCQKGKFTFLNLAHEFTGSSDFAGKIDWDFAGYGKLWSYNLNYFEFLNQPGMNGKTGDALMDSWIAASPNLKTGWEPYPVSLRSINWIKYFIRTKKFRTRHLQSLYSQLGFLTKNLEYHLLGNHLLENGFALFFGGLFLSEPYFLKTGQKILSAELKEQILPDGAHFELSPMYHSIMLERLLDIINLAGKGESKQLIAPGFYEFLLETSGRMYGWLTGMTFAGGSTPQFNDSAEGITRSARELLAYAQKLVPRKYLSLKLPLQESGYRKVAMKHYEAVIDVGPAGPDYIPGHAHCDMLSFVLHHKGRPLVVDTGVSTYEANERRMIERGTRAHNTVALAGLEQSEIWAAFRVARRARIIGVAVKKNEISAAHTGYRSVGITHRRIFRFDQKRFQVTDFLEGKGKAARGPAESLIHLAPGIKPKLLAPGRVKAGGATIIFEGAAEVYFEKYLQATGFNVLEPAIAIVAVFKDEVSYEFLL